MKYLKWCLWALLIPVIQSCAPTYLPNVVHSPMLFNNQIFDEKDSAFGTYIGINGIDAQAAFALNKRSAMLANLSVYPGSAYNYFGEAGIGNYSNFGKKQRLHFEYYGGAGLGFAKSSSDKASYGRLFVQPIFGYNRSLFETSIATRIVLVNHFKYQTGSTVEKVPGQLFFEPALTFRFGFGGEGFFENKKLCLQFGLSITPNADNLKFDYSPGLLSLGFLWRPKREY